MFLIQDAFSWIQQRTPQQEYLWPLEFVPVERNQVEKRN